METFNIVLAALTALVCFWVVPIMFYYWWWLDPKRFSASNILSFHSLFLLGVICGKLTILLLSSALFFQMIFIGQFPTFLSLPGRILALVAALLHLFCDLRVRLPAFMETRNRERKEEKVNE
jgi:hypothetical protein